MQIQLYTSKQESFQNLEEQSMSQPKNNRFNFNSTDLFYCNISDFPELLAEIKEREAHTFFLLVHSTRATSNFTLPQGEFH